MCVNDSSAITALPEPPGIITALTTMSLSHTVATAAAAAAAAAATATIMTATFM